MAQLNEYFVHLVRNRGSDLHLAGPLRMFSGVVYGALLAGIVIVVLLALRRITLKTFIPFGPFLIIGALWAIFAIK